MDDELYIAGLVVSVSNKLWDSIRLALFVSNYHHCSDIRYIYMKEKEIGNLTILKCDLTRIFSKRLDSEISFIYYKTYYQ